MLHARVAITRFKALLDTIGWWPAGTESPPTGPSVRPNWTPRRKPYTPRRIILATPPPTLASQEETRVRFLTCFRRMPLFFKRKQPKPPSRAFGPEFTSAVTSMLG